MYNDFAQVYDSLQDADYEAFVDYYEKIFEEYGVKPKLVLDLGCGTGNITIPMAKRGYDMIGLDLSCEMLNIARDKAKAEGLDVLFLNQDMCEMELYGTVDAVVDLQEKQVTVSGNADVALLKQVIIDTGYEVVE